jgi:PhzF family phenazine biosynthesis protein
MSTHRFLQVDVFTDRPLTGNQLAVFPEPAGLDTATMQAIAREMAFSETTFVWPAERAGTDCRVRIFTPRAEVPVAGHPTIGTTFALAHIGRLPPGTPRAVLDLGIGPTAVDLVWQGDRLTFVWMTQPVPRFGPVIGDLDGVAEALGLAGADELHPEPGEVALELGFLASETAHDHPLDPGVPQPADLPREQRAAADGDERLRKPAGGVAEALGLSAGEDDRLHQGAPFEARPIAA